MYCNNCGKEIPDNVEFCPYCGQKRNLAGTGINPGPKMVQGSVPLAERTAGTGKKRKKFLWILIPVCLAAIILFVVLKMNSARTVEKETRFPATLYAKGSSLMYVDFSSGKCQSRKVTDQYLASGNSYDSLIDTCYDLTPVSADGKILYYPENLEKQGYGVSFDLKMVKTSDLERKEDHSVEIASGVSMYSVLSDGAVVYRKNSTLYYKSGEKKILIGNNTGSWRLSSDRKKVIWEESDSDQEHGSLYCRDISSSGGQSVLIAGNLYLTDAGQYYCTDDNFANIYVNGCGSRNNSLCRFDSKGNQKEIDRDVYAWNGYDFIKSPYYEKKNGDRIELYYYDGEKSTRICKDIDVNLYPDEGIIGTRCDEGYCVFNDRTDSSLKIYHGNKQICSASGIGGDVREAVFDKQKQILYFTLLKGTGTENYDSNIMYSFRTNSSGNEEPAEMAEDVNGIRLCGDDLYYIADIVKNGMGTLFQNKKEICRDVSFFKCSKQDNSVLVKEGTTANGNIPTYIVYNGKDKKKINADISNYSFISGQCILVFYDKVLNGSQEKGSLGFYNGTRLIPIADNIMSFSYTRMTY